MAGLLKCEYTSVLKLHYKVISSLSYALISFITIYIKAFIILLFDDSDLSFYILLNCMHTLDVKDILGKRDSHGQSRGNSQESY